MEFIATLAGLLLATQVVAHLCRRVEIPEVIGQILVGIIVGPALLNWVHLDEMMNEFQEIGVIILMFIAGLESDLSLLKKYLRPAVIVAVIGVIVPVLVMGGASYLFGFTKMESLFIGVIFSATRSASRWRSCGSSNASIAVRGPRSWGPRLLMISSV